MLACIWTCIKHLADQPDLWCRECKEEDERRMDAAFEAHCDEQEAALIAAIPAATDAEWTARLDEIAPKVGDGAVEFRKLRLKPMPPGKPLPSYLANQEQQEQM